MSRPVFSLQPTFRGPSRFRFLLPLPDSERRLQLRANIAGPAGLVSMEMLVDEVLRSIFAHNNINIRIPVWKHNFPEEFHHVWPAPVNFVSSRIAFGA